MYKNLPKKRSNSTHTNPSIHHRPKTFPLFCSIPKFQNPKV
jgi:hypothetical protein